MSRSRERASLRKQRQAKRSWELTPEFIKEHPQASRIYVIFGRTIEACLAEVAKANAGLSARQRRAKAKEERDAVERMKARLRQEQMKKQWQEREKLKEEKQRKRFDMRGALRSMVRKGIA